QPRAGARAGGQTHGDRLPVAGGAAQGRSERRVAARMPPDPLPRVRKTEESRPDRRGGGRGSEETRAAAGGRRHGGREGRVVVAAGEVQPARLRVEGGAQGRGRHGAGGPGRNDPRPNRAAGVEARAAGGTAGP